MYTAEVVSNQAKQRAFEPRKNGFWKSEIARQQSRIHHNNYLGAHMKKITLALSLALATFASAQAASINGLVNTGTGASGTQDMNYALSVTQGSTVLPNTNGYVAFDSMFPLGPWMANSSASKWLTPTASQGQSFDPSVDGVYRYTLNFDLTGYNASSASFLGRFAADNSATVTLNGNQIGSAGGFTSWSNFGAGTGFAAGVNTLTFDVLNWKQNGGNPTGLRVEFTESNISAVPEPETYGMLLAGLGLMAFVARRRKA